MFYFHSRPPRESNEIAVLRAMISGCGCVLGVMLLIGRRLFPTPICCGNSAMSSAVVCGGPVLAHLSFMIELALAVRPL